MAEIYDLLLVRRCVQADISPGGVPLDAATYLDTTFVDAEKKPGYMDTSQLHAADAATKPGYVVQRLQPHIATG